MRVAVGTLRRAKLEAVRLAFQRVAEAGLWMPDGIELVPADVPSGVSAMPMNEPEGITGARNRAHICWERLDVDLALGLEGGVVVLPGPEPTLILRNWAVAWDGRIEWIGSGPGVQLPSSLARSVLSGVELGDAIDVFAGAHDIRSGKGTFGVLTRDLMDRPYAFAEAVVAALVPWYNSAMIEGEVWP